MNTTQTSDLLRATGGRRPIQIFVQSPDDLVGQMCEFRQPFVLIGKNKKSNLRLNNPSVGNRQLYVQLVGGKLFGVNLSSRVPTFWGDAEQPSGWLDGRQSITIGPFVLRFPGSEEVLPGDPNHLDPLAVASYPGPPVTLELQNSNSGRRLVIDRRITLVGNGSICKIRMNSSRVSEVHCSLVRTGGGLLVVDLGSREGVVVNGTAVRAAILAPGDVIDIAGRCLRVNYDTSESPRPIGATPPDVDDGASFAPTELAGPSDRRSPPNSQNHSDSGELITALGPVMDRFSAHQSQTYDQFQEMLATMLRVFGAMFTEHREFVKEELTRLDGLARLLANQRPEPAGGDSGNLETTRPLAPDLSVPLPPLSAGPPADEIHVWLQQRIGEMGEERASLLKRMAGMIRPKTTDSPQK